jgi:hypothetical protein
MHKSPVTKDSLLARIHMFSTSCYSSLCNTLLNLNFTKGGLPCQSSISEFICTDSMFGRDAHIYTYQ